MVVCVCDSITSSMYVSAACGLSPPRYAGHKLLVLHKNANEFVVRRVGENPKSLWIVINSVFVKENT